MSNEKIKDAASLGWIDCGGYDHHEMKILTAEELLKRQIETNSLPTIHFVRHGQSLANAGGITQPNADIELTDLGHEQARIVASMLPKDTPFIITSEFYRAKQTAAYLEELCGLRLRVEPLLNEFSSLCHTVIEGLNGAQRKPIIDKYWEQSDPHQVNGISAESFFQTAKRVERFRLEWLNQLPHQTVIFGHGMWFGMLAWQLLGFGFSDSWSMRAFRRYQTGMPMPNCFSYDLQRQASGEWLIRANTEIISKMYETERKHGI